MPVGNQPARSRYPGAGFTRYGALPRYIRVGDADFNIEQMGRHRPAG